MESSPFSLVHLSGLSGKVPGLSLAKKKAGEAGESYANQTPFPAAGILSYVPRALSPRRGQAPRSVALKRRLISFCRQSSHGCRVQVLSRLVLLQLLGSASLPRPPNRVSFSSGLDGDGAGCLQPRNCDKRTHTPHILTGH